MYNNNNNGGACSCSPQIFKGPVAKHTTKLGQDGGSLRSTMGRGNLQQLKGDCIVSAFESFDFSHPV